MKKPKEAIERRGLSMDAKMLRDLFRSGDSYLVTSYRGEAGSIKEADNLILRALDALIEKDAREAAVEGSTDEIVRELRGQHCRDFGSDPQCDADGLCICAMHERAAAALVAERAAKEKAEAERDGLKQAFDLALTWVPNDHATRLREQAYRAVYKE